MKILLKQQLIILIEDFLEVREGEKLTICKLELKSTKHLQNLDR